MAAITTRQTPGGAVAGITNNNAPLSNTQLDQNFINIGSDLNNAVYLATAQTITGIKTFSNGLISGSTSYPSYSASIDFGNDVGGTWRKIITISSPNVQYSTIGFKVEVTDPQANHATTSSPDSIITHVYWVACVRTNDIVLDTPDSCYVRGPGSLIRAVKTSTGNYEIQVQCLTQYRELTVDISVYAVNGAHTVTYSAGTTASTGTVQYSATTGSYTDWFGNISATGSVYAGGLLTANSGIYRATGNGVAYWLQQDGTGRNHWYWGTAGGTSPTFSNAGEDASALTIGVTNNGSGGQFFHRSASGVGKNAGDAITWTTTIYSDINTFTWKGNTVWHSGNDGVGSGLDADLLDGQSGSYYTNAGNLSGTIPSGVLGNSSFNIGTTSIALNRASAAQSLTGVSIDGNAGTVTNGVYTTGSYSDPTWLTITKSKVGLSNVENTALSTWAGSTNITTIGAATATSLSITGNLTVNGTTTTINSTTVTIDDPIFTLGGDTAPTTDDNKDRGIEFRWHNGTAAKVGFFGYDDSTGKFTFVPDATNTSEVFAGTKGTVDANLEWADVLSKPNYVASVATTAPLSGGAAGSVGGALTLSLAANYGDTQNPFGSKTANTFLAAPNGSAGSPTFRAIVASDIPTLNQNTTGTASNVTGTVAIANGGTGQTTQQAAINTLAGGVTSGQYLRGNGTNVTMSAIQVADVPTLNQNTTGNAATATTLQTARNINGVSFNGSADITVADSTKLPLAGGNLTGVLNTSATSLTINTTTPGTGTYHLNFTGQATADYAHGITWGWSTSGAQAGIYVQSSGSYGTKMYIATTDSFAAGSKTAISIDHLGVANFVRARPTYAGNTILDAGNFTSYVNNATLTMNVSGNGLSGSQTFTSNQGTAATFTVTSNATNANTASTIVFRDASGNFSAGTITAALSGNATTATSASNIDGVAFNNSNSTNPISAANTLDSNGIGYVTNVSLFGQTDGALYSQAYNSSWQHQIYGDYRTGQIAIRGENNGTWQAWRTVLDSSNYSSYALPLSGGTVTGVTTFTNASDVQIVLNGASTAWAGIQFTDVDATDNLYYRGATSTFSIGGGGSVVSGKKLHINGGTSIGNGIAATAVPTNGLLVEGALNLDSGIGFRRGSGDYGTYIKSSGYPGQGYANTDGNRYWVELGGAGGVHVVLNTDGGASGAENTYDHFTIWQGSNEGTRLHWTTNAGHTTSAGSSRAPIFYDNNDTGYYLDPNATTSLKIAGNIEQGNNLSHPNVEWAVGGNSTGMIIFSLPGAASTNYGMVHMVFDYYEYVSGRTATVIIGGHNWSTSWYETGCTVIGNLPKEVRLGVRDGKYCVVFGVAGSTWSYGTIRLRKIHNAGFYDNVVDVGGSYGVVQTTLESFTNVTGDLRQFYTPKDSYAYAYRGHSNVAGTGEASFHPAGIYSTGTNWLYGSVITNGNTIDVGTGSISGSAFYSSSNSGYYVNPTGTSRLSTIYCGNVYNDLGGWFRSYGNTGLYSESYGNHFYATSDAYWNIAANNGSVAGLIFRTGGHGGTVRGYVYSDSSSNIGFLNQNGNWAARTVAGDYWLVDGSSARAPLFYDSNNTGYYCDPSSLSYLYTLQLSGAGYFRPNSWIQLDSTYGLYWPNHYGAHLHANDLSTYTQIALRGGKNSYGGIYDQYSAVNGMMYDSGGNGGVYREANGRWYTYYHLGNDCLGIGTSSTNSAYGIYCGKGLYAGGRVDGTIFYDANDTSYYIDPNSTSITNDLRANIFYDRADTDGQIDPVGHSRLKYAGHASSGNVSALEIKNTGGTGDGDVAAISWHCSGQYGLQMHLRNDGYFGIGGWSASSWRWYVNNTNGDMTAAGNVTAYSDPRLKEEVTPIVSALEKIKQLNGVHFRWKDISELGKPGSYDYGILATDVEKIAPELVCESAITSPDGDRYKTVAYDKLTPFLIEAIKEQQKIIEAQELRLQALEKLLGVNP